jgi:hypothetical protein
MHHTLSHRQGAGADIDDQQQFAFRIYCRPHPVGGTLKAFDGVVFAELSVFDVTEHGIQLVQLSLAHVHVAENVARQRPELLCRFHQPVKDCVRVHLKHAGGGTNASALGQTCQRAYDQRHRYSFAMQERAVRFQKVAVAGGTLALTPRATTGMTIGAKIA